jgi:hypothetical protein
MMKVNIRMLTGTVKSKALNKILKRKEFLILKMIQLKVKLQSAI